ncbi:hypothetical protein D3C87_1915340 [compost metagenome]
MIMSALSAIAFASADGWQLEIRSSGTLGTTDMSAKRVFPSLSAAIVFTHGVPCKFANAFRTSVMLLDWPIRNH